MAFEEPFGPLMPLHVAQAKLRELADDGARCPCCTQNVKVYRRTIYATMAKELIALYRQAGRDWCYLPDSVVARGGDMVKVRYWGLIEEDHGTRPDGSNRIGWWRVTSLGEAWILGAATVQKYARVYDGRCLGTVGPPLLVADALGDKFSYRELMS